VLISHATKILAWKKSCDLILHYYCKLEVNFEYNFWNTSSNISPSNFFLLLECVSSSQTTQLTRCLLLPMRSKNNLFLFTEKCLVILNKIPYQTTIWFCQTFSFVWLELTRCPSTYYTVRPACAILFNYSLTTNITSLPRKRQFIFCYFPHI
jgi:hypothetical protein